jgi:hypothetical protein
MRRSPSSLIYSPTQRSRPEAVRLAGGSVFLMNGELRFFSVASFAPLTHCRADSCQTGAEQ